MAEELEVLLKRGEVALAKNQDLSLRGLAAAMMADEYAQPEVQAFPELPKVRRLTDAARVALTKLSEVFGRVQPTERVLLDNEERAMLVLERQILTTVSEEVKAREEAIKETMRTQMDVQAEKDGRANPQTTERDRHGHYLLAKPGVPETLDVPEMNGYWERTYRTGTTKVDTDTLLKMYEQGDISRTEYLALTESVRVPSERKIMAFIRQHPQRGLKLLAQITQQDSPTVAITFKHNAH